MKREPEAYIPKSPKEVFELSSTACPPSITFTEYAEKLVKNDTNWMNPLPTTWQPTPFGATCVYASNTIEARGESGWILLPSTFNPPPPAGISSNASKNEFSWLEIIEQFWIYGDVVINAFGAKDIAKPDWESSTDGNTLNPPKVISAK